MIEKFYILLLVVLSATSCQKRNTNASSEVKDQESYKRVIRYIIGGFAGQSANMVLIDENGNRVPNSETFALCNTHCIFDGLRFVFSNTSAKLVDSTGETVAEFGCQNIPDGGPAGGGAYICREQTSDGNSSSEYQEIAWNEVPKVHCSTYEEGMSSWDIIRLFDEADWDVPILLTTGYFGEEEPVYEIELEKALKSGDKYRLLGTEGEIVDVDLGSLKATVKIPSGNYDNMIFTCKND